MKRSLLLFLVLASMALMASQSAIADTVFNNFAAGHGYNCCTGWTVSGSTSPPGLSTSANEFTALVTGSVSQIDVAVGWVTGTNGATVSFWTDNSGTPGAMLGSWDISNLPTFGTCCSFSTISGISGINVSAGQNYFLLLSAPSDTWDAWNFNSTGDKGLVVQSTDGGATWHLADNGAPGTQNRSAFDVLTNPVPEPGSLALLGSGVLVLAGNLRRKFLR